MLRGSGGPDDDMLTQDVEVQWNERAQQVDPRRLVASPSSSSSPNYLQTPRHHVGRTQERRPSSLSKTSSSGGCTTTPLGATASSRREHRPLQRRIKTKAMSSTEKRQEIENLFCRLPPVAASSDTENSTVAAALVEVRRRSKRSRPVSTITSTTAPMPAPTTVVDTVTAAQAFHDNDFAELLKQFDTPSPPPPPPPLSAASATVTEQNAPLVDASSSSTPLGRRPPPPRHSPAQPSTKISVRSADAAARPPLRPRNNNQYPLPNRDDTTTATFKCAVAADTGAIYQLRHDDHDDLRFSDADWAILDAAEQQAVTASSSMATTTVPSKDTGAANTSPSSPSSPDMLNAWSPNSADLAVMDVIVAQAQQCTLQMATTLADETVIVPQKLPDTPKAASILVNDEWDDNDDVLFDEIDYDALDCSIAAHYNESQHDQAFVKQENVESTADLNRESIVAQQLQFDRVAKESKDAASTTMIDDDDALFADMDFAALDRSVAAHCADQHQLTSTAPTQPEQLTFSRYMVLDVQDDVSTYTRTLSVTAWHPDMRQRDKAKAIHRREDLERVSALDRDDARPNQWPVHGHVHLCGEWFHTPVTAGDIVHVCSLSGRYRTEPDALPIVLHTMVPQPNNTTPDAAIVNDLVLVVHPDLLLTPTGISETLTCSRRAVLRSRLGSSGLTTLAPLLGTMRHELFEATMKDRDSSLPNAARHVKSILRRHAEDLLACDASSLDAEREVIRMVPQLQRFAAMYTHFDASHTATSPPLLLEKHGAVTDHTFAATDVEAVEEPFVIPALGLKGNVDMVMQASIAPHHATNGTVQAMIGVELKTGHMQKTQQAHAAQLSLYILMLRARYGSASRPLRDNAPVWATNDGVLLYMNNETFRAVHVRTLLPELKSLIGQRNVVAAETVRVFQPRGVTVVYDSCGDAHRPRAEIVEAPPTQLPSLPPNGHPCKRCYAARECMAHVKAANVHSDAPVSLCSEQQSLLDQYTGQLTNLDLEYFHKWDRLIDLEAHAATTGIAEAWLVPSQTREQQTAKTIGAVCFVADRMSQSSFYDDSCLFILTFRRHPTSTSKTPLDGLSFEPGSHVVVSIDTELLDRTINNPHMHIVRGVVHRVRTDSIEICGSDDDLLRLQKVVTRSSQAPATFRIDKDEVATGIGTLRQNLINLITSDAQQDEKRGALTRQNRLPRLRRNIIHLEQPTFGRFQRSQFFDDGDSRIGPSCTKNRMHSEFDTLNADQKRAVESIFCAHDYAMVQGLPGTGKTSIIAFAARLLAAKGKRVLITSYTHAAVDNVFIKLLELAATDTPEKANSAQSLCRIGRISSCHKTVRPIMASELAKSFERDVFGIADDDDGNEPSASAEALKAVVASARIVGATALTVPRSPLLLGQQFDVVIVDESGQITQPAIVGALMAADTFVLVGDHKQLPPLVVSEVAERGGYGDSMLKRLADQFPEAVAQLTLQYRMNSDICELSNAVVYNGALKCGNESVSRRRLHMPKWDNPSMPSATQWISQTIDPSRPVVFLNTDAIPSKFQENAFLERMSSGQSGSSIINDVECSVVHNLVAAIVGYGVPATDIGIVCPFRAQLRLLEDNHGISMYKERGLELSTIDRFQGRDKPVIILSFVRSNQNGRVGRLLEDARRLNVAVSRAKFKMVMVGSFSTLYRGSDAIKPMLDLIKHRGWLMQLPAAALTNS